MAPDSSRYTPGSGAILLPQWSDKKRKSVCNAIFATFAIPIEVLPPTKDFTLWRVVIHGGTILEAIDRCHDRQNKIAKKLDLLGVEGLSRREAMFMYVSQWLEYTALRQPDEPINEDAEDVMEQWHMVYHRLGETFIN